MDIHRLPNGNVTDIQTKEVAAFAALRHGCRVTRLRWATAWRAKDESITKHIRHCRIVLTLVTIAPLSICGAAKNVRQIEIRGDTAVPVHYGSLNKMIVPVEINGLPANLIIDTGAAASLAKQGAGTLCIGAAADTLICSGADPATPIKTSAKLVALANFEPEFL